MSKSNPQKSNAWMVAMLVAGIAVGISYVCAQDKPAAAPDKPAFASIASRA